MTIQTTAEVFLEWYGSTSAALTDPTQGVGERGFKELYFG